MKHEAFAVRKSNGRAVPAAFGDDDCAPLGADDDAWTDERAERYERLRVGAEAMANLKPQEIRCLLLRAEGLSYKEICAATGWTYTKVNRCVTEGRRAFLARLASIESGAECERLAPLISRLADGEASAEELARVRPHLKTCLACKATLREYRAAPARLAGLVPPVAALTGGSGGTGGFVLRALQGLHDRFGALLENASVPKAAAVAVSAALLASGGAAGVEAIHHDAPAVAPSAFARSGTPATATNDPASAATPVADPAAPASAAPAPVAPAQATFDPQPADPAPTEPSPEFDPGMGAADTGSAGTAVATTTPRGEADARPGSTDGSAPAQHGSTSGSGPAAEFGP